MIDLGVVLLCSRVGVMVLCGRVESEVVDGQDRDGKQRPDVGGVAGRQEAFKDSVIRQR